SKNTISDLKAMISNGCAEVIADSAHRGVAVVGICGGYQMLGLTVDDPEGIEGYPCAQEGLGLLPIRTSLKGEKVVRRVKFSMDGCPDLCEGYEVHNGETYMEPGAFQPITREDGTRDGCVAGNIFGSYMHGILDNIAVIDYLLKPYEAKKGLPESGEIESYRDFKDRQYNKLADRLRSYLNIDLLYEIMRKDD
ncbi:MAG: cobyric acid synthase, partial [Muribaculaceae bacterium]|nr:cobyric acid synthase [Muribaculaceae bacterium]